MIKLINFFLIIFINCNLAYSRNSGETEITTEDGIEVFQEEKFYLLKKNVEISSDEFDLKGQLVKIYFENDLYDIKELIAKDDVTFNSELYNLRGKGSNVKIEIKNEEILVYGEKSELYLESTEMLSDGKINVNNIDGSFFINGPNSKLINESIFINGSKINGSFEIIDGKRDISNLIVEDDKKLNIKTDDIVMFSKRAVYNKKESIIELFEDVIINRGNEIITGDYGILNIEKNSYKVTSKNSNKVKAIISSTNE